MKAPRHLLGMVALSALPPLTQFDAKGWMTRKGERDDSICMWLLQDFAVGVVCQDGRYRLIDSGPLPEAVAASAAIPFIFAPVNVPGAQHLTSAAGVSYMLRHVDMALL